MNSEFKRREAIVTASTAGISRATAEGLANAGNPSVLFKPYRLNSLHLPNRLVMAPMTRSASPGGVPTPEVAVHIPKVSRDDVRSRR